MASDSLDGFYAAMADRRMLLALANRIAPVPAALAFLSRGPPHLHALAGNVFEMYVRDEEQCGERIVKTFQKIVFFLFRNS
jgi:hypothetical protein